MIPHPRASLGLQLNPGAPGPRPTDPPERRRASLEQAISILFLIALHTHRHTHSRTCGRYVVPESTTLQGGGRG